ncbi:MAG: hypothetical protein AM326_01785 [Candidatus Thorarchaeota archaeon SMTZ-45]|nr:MAG: hypothetical protein AM326_01785 [Candidatus Thorarchaeota archaeon SMTZ-45]
MRDLPALIICLIMVAVMGYWTGYNEGYKMKPPVERSLIELSREVSELQKDVIRWQETAYLLLIRMSFMEEWKASVLYRPPDLLEEDDNVGGTVKADK